MPTPGEIILAKALMPTADSSAEIRERISAQIRARSVFSARTPSMRYLAKLQEVLAKAVDGEINNATARTELAEFGRALGYTSDGGFPGEEATPPAEADGLQDLLSEKRLALILDTNRKLASSARQQADGNSDYALYAYPAWSLERRSTRSRPRGDWAERWRAAGESVAWEGAAQPAVGILGEPRMIALKDSPIWAALGRGEGGYEDVLDTSMPPFAYGSGLGWVPVKRVDAEALGLLANGDPGATAMDLSPTQKEWDNVFDALGDGGIADLMRKLGGAA
jgi:hypothetical protein